MRDLAILLLTVAYFFYKNGEKIKNKAVWEPSEVHESLKLDNTMIFPWSFVPYKSYTNTSLTKLKYIWSNTFGGWYTPKTLWWFTKNNDCLRELTV